MCVTCLRPTQRGEEGAPSRLRDGGDEGLSEVTSAHLPLTFPIATQWASFLSPLARGEDIKQGAK